MTIYRFIYTSFDSKSHEIVDTVFYAGEIDDGIRAFVNDDERVGNEFRIEIINGNRRTYLHGKVTGTAYKLWRESYP